MERIDKECVEVRSMAKSKRTGGDPGSARRRTTLFPLARRRSKRRSGRGTGLPPKELEALVSEATVDCHDEEEQLLGFFNMIEENLAVPFETSILGIPAVVESVEERKHRIVAICRRGNERQVISLLDLAMPSPPPRGSEWIEAYRHWSHF